ncbi:MAG: hypothetical protein JST79_18180 [Acidobacteria bacterium]|nr:hypothetical protein [Acidobacteriota bacterium]
MSLLRPEGVLLFQPPQANPVLRSAILMNWLAFAVRGLFPFNFSTFQPIAVNSDFRGFDRILLVKNFDRHQIAHFQIGGFQDLLLASNRRLFGKMNIDMGVESRPQDEAIRPQLNNVSAEPCFCIQGRRSRKEHKS